MGEEIKYKAFAICKKCGAEICCVYVEGSDYFDKEAACNRVREGLIDHETYHRIERSRPELRRDNK